MTDTTKDGGPAFPRPGSNNNERQKGMTLRDWFAGQAPDPSEEWVSSQRHMDRSRNPYNEAHKPRLREDVEIRAQYRFAYADAMIAARDAK